MGEPTRDEVTRRYERGFACLRAGEVGEAIKLWTPLVRDKRISPPTYLREIADGVSAHAGLDPVVWSFIVEVLEESHGRGVEDDLTLSLLANGYVMTGDQRAGGITDILVARHPRDWRSWRLKALTCPPAKAGHCLRTALALQPFSDDRMTIELFNELGQAHLTLGETDSVLVLAKRLCHHPQTIWSGVSWTMGLYLAFLAYLKSSDWDSAEVAARTILNGISNRAPLTVPSEFAAGKRSLIYIHVPKTGGVSLNKALVELNALNAGHRQLTRGESGFDRYYMMSDPSTLSLPAIAGEGCKIFSSVRNIYAHLFSVYHWARRGWTGSWAMHSVWANRYDFEGWLLKASENEETWISKGLVFFPLFEEISGELVVDWVLRTESLQDDLNAMCAAWGLDAPAVPHENRGTHGDHRSHYTPRMVDLVENTWADDIRLFGFDFETGYRDGALLHRDTSGAKEGIRYDRTSRRVRFLDDVPDHPDLMPFRAR
ncbi:MAG: hypothetical protein HQL39_12830 [Alphaproteobacteria bacterium]|nr:hypothetical protein [Alphaproteobacteria bacterium]